MHRLLAPIAFGTITMSTGCLSQPVEWTLEPSDLTSPAQVDALNKAASAALVRCEDVALRFEPGVYRGVHLFIDDRGRKLDCGVTLTIDRAGEAGSVIFEGAQRPKFIDIVTHRASFPGTIRNIELRDYMNGIVLTRTHARKGEKIVAASDTAGAAPAGDGLTISNVTFRQVGDWDQTEEPNATGWGAIVLNYVNGNRVVGNRFEGLGNTVESPLMHAAYLFGSSRNLIAGNVFGAMDGAVVKVRNRSNGNRIENNSFRFGGEPLVQLWFCNQSVQGSDRCAIDECPSTGTLFQGNRIVVSPSPDRTRRGGGPVPVIHPFVSYEEAAGLKLVERFYAVSGVPKSCGPVAPGPLVTPSAANIIDRTD